MTDTQLRDAIKSALKAFQTQPLLDAGLGLFDALGYGTRVRQPLESGTYSEFKSLYADNSEYLASHGLAFREERARSEEWRNVQLLFQLTGEQCKFGGRNASGGGGSGYAAVTADNEQKKVDRQDIRSYLFFAIDLAGERYSRSALAAITREVNKVFPMPVMIIFRYCMAKQGSREEGRNALVTLAVINRRVDRRDESRDVLEKVSLIKDIRCGNPHRAHIDILCDLSFDTLQETYHFTDFAGLHNAWMAALDTKLLNKRFYAELFAWYDERAIKLVKFPVGKGYDASIEHDKGSAEDIIRNRENLIRLITRVMFVWFIKQKWGERLDWIFDEAAVRQVLRDGTDLHSTKDGTYYNAILQNLFFATLNRQIKDEEGDRRSWATAGGDGGNDDYTVKNKWRDDKEKSFFRITRGEFAELMNKIPFLNGGLFECLDTADGENMHQVVYRDGFSRERKRRAFVPNALFFGSGGTAMTADSDRKIGDGLFDIFRKYYFTVEESTPLEVQVALDPELLGAVFENLLASFNPETQESARKDSGSFYTPREIVGYMADETLKAVLAGSGYAAVTVDSDGDRRRRDGSTRVQGFGDLADGNASGRGGGSASKETALAALFSDDDTPLDMSEAERRALIRRICNLKVLDPACGSGAFPMGVLLRLASILAKLDPNGSEYAHKRYLIENCIYGVDIQSIAMQITKLRFFISLVIEQEMTGDSGTNYGIRALPNLETKFVCANTLIGIKREEGMFIDRDIEAAQNALLDVRRQYVTASSYQTKKRLQREDKRYVKRLLELLEKNSMCSTEEARLLSQWSPYNHAGSAPFFDSQWMFCVEKFDAVAGNPPYGAKTSEKEKAYYKAAYPACRTAGGVKGSTDTFTAFINRGLDLLAKDGVLSFIVPMSVTSSDAMGALHKMLFETCETIRVSSYAVRPQPVFQNAVVNTSIIAVKKTLSPCKHLYATKMYRKGRGVTLQSIVDNLTFAEVNDYCLQGRIPKVSYPIEVSILKKLSTLRKISSIMKDKGAPIYYRFAGGRYFKIVTNYSTGSSAEKVLLFDKNVADLVGCVLSSNLAFWFYQVYSDNLNWKGYEIGEFRVPPLGDNEADNKIKEQMLLLYREYLADIEKNANVRESTGASRYKVDTFKEYKIGRSKPLIDRIDDLICPLYGLDAAETAFIKSYEAEFRMEEGE